MVGERILQATALALLVAVGTLMYACKGQPEKDELATAAMDGDLSRVKDLFAIVGTFDYHGAEYPPPITSAAVADQYEVVNFILDHGGSINVIDGGGFTTLSKLLIYKNREMIEYLLLRGAELNDKDRAFLTGITGEDGVRIRQICADLKIICVN